MPQPPTERTYFEPIRTRLRSTLGSEHDAARAAGRLLALAEAMAEARAIRGIPATTRADAVAPRTLTSREREILRWLIAGESNREIGERLYISPTTVARHVANIFAKLGVDSRAKAIAHAHRYGLIED